jgi:hypothetical protein
MIIDFIVKYDAFSTINFVYSLELPKYFSAFLKIILLTDFYFVVFPVKTTFNNMIRKEELRIGNKVYWKPDFTNTNLLIEVEITSVSDNKAGYIQSHLEHRVEPFEDDLLTAKVPHATFEELEPIAVTGNFLKRIDEKINYPKWIRYLHELQNWYYWNNGKKELEISD